jgi:putative NIF3 family GTP cyclohydrolase 1 type 2
MISINAELQLLNGMETEEALKIALDMAGFTEVPGDTAIHVPGNFTKPLVAIDVGVSELLLAKSLGCDGVIAHHPSGISHINFYRVLERHIDFMRSFGIKGDLYSPVQPIEERSKLRAHVSIAYHVVDAAKRLNMPFMNVHLPCDEIGRKIMETKVNNSGPKVKDVIDLLSALPEFRNGIKPEVVLGREENKRGKTALVVAAGTNGGYAVAKKYFISGFDTVIYMHIDQEDLRKLREDPETKNKNLILIGHAPGDSVGINAYLAELKKRDIKPTTIGIMGEK